ncbi:hypothetical protein CIK05_13730 [Bdellovibrio sp. qaytius]|nr:hypothetical protein CIK05_13730 [Bdellovibrio sp. qaytius]
MTMNTNRIIELALVFFISLFSFSIGTFVGKKYSDNQHRLALLEPNKKTDERKEVEAAANTEATTNTNESEITDADVAKMAEEFSAEGDQAQNGEAIHGAATGATASGDAHGEVTKDVKEVNVAPMQIHSKTATNTNQAATKNVKTVKADVKDVKDIPMHEDDVEAASAREVASISAKAKTMQNYTVQVGSYPSEVEANKMTESLVARGYKANAVAANVNGKTMYRVQVGMFNSFNDAQEYKKELVEKNRLTSAFVQKVSK